ncbi:MAG: hypothetical protein NVSMB52_11850 [Chloroflexota bacterium]
MSKKRQSGKSGRQSPSTSARFSVPLTVLGVLLLAAIASVIAFRLRASHADSTPSASKVTPTVISLARVIDGVPCNAEDVTYHQHSHLTILLKGKPMAVPANTGIHGNSCLYWLHTHDDSGEIHMEAPRPRTFTLGNFFDIWGEPLSRTRAASAIVASGSVMHVYVGRSLYTGDPRTVVLRRHTQVTIEVGPPFSPPQPFDFGTD